MMEGDGGEMDAGSNFGVKRLDIINSVKSDMEDMCPLTVSCADIIAMAGRDAVAYNGGPEIQIPLGRKDADFSSATEAEAKLPPATSNVDRVLNVFAPFGMSIAESVAILGTLAFPYHERLYLPSLQRSYCLNPQASLNSFTL